MSESEYSDEPVEVEDFGVNYRLRPAKNIERKMMIKILRRLQHIRPLENYQYVGFGSPYFSDFKLFHKELNINNMYSIEKMEEYKQRFIFNKPYECINMKFDHSNDALEDLDLHRYTILWLDYTTELKPYMFKDIKKFCQDALFGSVLFITLNCEGLSYKELQESNYESRREKLEDDVGSDNIPPGVNDIDLREEWSLAEAYRQIILKKIEADFLPPRNDELDNDAEFKQLSNFVYEDSTKMVTIGGILHHKDIRAQYEKANFREVDVAKNGSNKCEIIPPKLTLAEMRNIEKKLPNGLSECDVPLSDGMIHRYADLYKYFPRFVESVV